LGWVKRKGGKMIQLFHAGTSEVHNGITCEMATVNEYGFEHLLDDGWHFTPEECYPSTKEETPKVADSKVTAPETSVSDKALKTEKPDKTTTKTAAKK
jgi:hypothetical protein